MFNLISTNKSHHGTATERAIETSSYADLDITRLIQSVQSRNGDFQLEVFATASVCHGCGLELVLDMRRFVVEAGRTCRRITHECQGDVLRVERQIERHCRFSFRVLVVE